MIAAADIDRIVLDAASAHIPAHELRRVSVEPYINSVEQEGLQIMVVLAGSSPSLKDGRTLLDTMLEVSDRLALAGEPRAPVLTFATEDELAHSGDTDI